MRQSRAMRRIAAWFRSHPLTTSFLVVVGCAVGAHLFANWRAEVRWQSYCTEARARGVKLTLAEFAPPEIPDSENFAKIPMLRTAFTQGAPTPFKMPRPRGMGPPAYNYTKGERIDFQAWAIFFRDAGFISQTSDVPPRDVLLALEHYAPQFKEWGEWRSRPHCQFPVPLDASGWARMPNYDIFSGAYQIFTLRMRAHLAVGDSAAALSDFQDGWQAYRALENPSSLVGAVLRMGLLAVLCSQLGESLAPPGWADAELRQIQEVLATANEWKDYRQGLSAERAMVNSLYDKLAQSPAERRRLGPVMLLAAPGSWKNTAFGLIPSRVFRDNQLRQNQCLDEQLANVSADELHFDPDRAVPSDPENLKGYLDDFYFSFCKLFTAATSAVTDQSVSIQTRLDQTRLAVALERFRLAHGAFPEQLTELVPDFIAAVPVDTYSRQPMIYRRKEGGTFLLYGVGKNRVDDGGVSEAKGSDGENSTSSGSTRRRRGSERPSSWGTEPRGRDI